MTFSSKEAAQHYPFLLEQLHLSPAALVLQYKAKKNWPLQRLAQQLNGLQRAKKKLPTWFQKPAILYPPNLNLEQSSSEATARYKAALVNGTNAADLTGGFGVDTYHFAQNVKHLLYLEQHPTLFEITTENFKTLDVYIECINTNAEEWIKTTPLSFDWLYCDPSRRNHTSRKFLLKDCEPNLETLLPVMQVKASNILLKLSPLIDIKSLLDTLAGLKEIHVVAVKNECKEVLAILGKDEQPTIIKTANLDPAGNILERFDFDWEAENAAQPEYSKIGTYLYEPNAAILKAGAHKLIATHFRLQKLHTNTHLYTSAYCNPAWPGRVFETVSETWHTANIISRNHPLTPKQLAKKYQLKDGTENQYLLAFTDLEKPKALFCKRLK